MDTYMGSRFELPSLSKDKVKLFATLMKSYNI